MYTETPALSGCQKVIFQNSKRWIALLWHHMIIYASLGLDELKDDLHSMNDKINSIQMYCQCPGVSNQIKGRSSEMSRSNHQALLKELIPSLRSWLWHQRLPNFTTEVQPRFWSHLAVCGVTAMTSNSVSISILLWYHKINFKVGDAVKPSCLSAPQV